jgi:dephospho-CoA kinase
LIHPVIQERRATFLQDILSKAARSVVCEIPLLEKTQHNSILTGSTVLLVTSPLLLKRRRALRRKWMTNMKFEAIIEKQISDEKRMQSANLAVVNSGSVLSLKKRLRRLLGGRFKKNSSRYGNHGIERQRRA